MNAEQIAKLKEVALKAPKNPGEWPFYLRSFQAAATPAAILELIALAEHSLSAQDEVLTKSNPQPTYAEWRKVVTLVQKIISTIRTGPAIELALQCLDSLDAWSDEVAAAPSPAVAVEDEMPITMTTNTTNSQAASIADDVEFWNLIEAYGAARGPATKENLALCAYIDAKLAQAHLEKQVAESAAEIEAKDRDEWKARATAAEARLAEIQRGVEGLQGYDKARILVSYADVLVLLQPQGQADTSGLPG